MISEQLTKIRKQNNLTMKEVASMLGVSLSAYQKYENGTRDVSTDTLSKLADFYGVTTDYLLGREPQTDPIAMLNFNMGEDEIIREYMTLPANVRAIILDTLEQLAEARKRSIDKSGE